MVQLSLLASFLVTSLHVPPLPGNASSPLSERAKLILADEVPKSSVKSISVKGYEELFFTLKIAKTGSPPVKTSPKSSPPITSKVTGSKIPLVLTSTVSSLDFGTHPTPISKTEMSSNRLIKRSKRSKNTYVPPHLIIQTG